MFLDFLIPNYLASKIKFTYLALFSKCLQLGADRNVSGADKWPITECSVQIFNKDFFGLIFFALCPQ